ncbi:hypothetical protein BRADI_3g39032v3 [Brachypodium distachyon]|uniref:Uncharacterized protein n=1 Tax=Brachypodium distachyon TaxID=15368 RepID=I1I851_BRADI|nr:hypothetical protein BRADI_3g39032v3 [Brachypodium distachyon]
MARAMFVLALLLAAVAVAPFAQARNVVTEKKGDSESSEAPAPAADAPAEGPEGPASSPEPSAADAPEPSASD